MPSIKFQIEELAGALKLGKSLTDQAKNSSKSLGFIVTEDESSFYFINSTNVIRSTLDVIEVDLDGRDEWQFSLSPDELTKIIDSYRSSTLTFVDHIEFVLEDNFLNIIVSEVARDGVDDSFTQESHWRLNVKEPVANDVKRAGIAFPDEVHPVAPMRLQGYLKSLTPLLSKGTGATSQLTFSKDYIFVKPTQVTALFKNKLVDEETQDFTLTVSGIPSVNELIGLAEKDINALELEEGQDVNDLDDIMLDLGFVYKAKPGKGTADGEATPSARPSKPDYIAMRYKGVELFLRNITTTQARLGSSSDIFETEEDENGKTIFTNRHTGIVVDRRYFRAILKRLEVANNDVVISFDEDMVVQAGDFSQHVPLIATKGDVGAIKFRVGLQLLSKLVIGDDNVFTKKDARLFMYFLETKQGYRLFVTDSSNNWSADINVSAKR